MLPISVRQSCEALRTFLMACAVPGASVVYIAFEHGLNPNLVQRWCRMSEGYERSAQVMPGASQIVSSSFTSCTWSGRPLLSTAKKSTRSHAEMHTYI